MDAGRLTSGAAAYLGQVADLFLSIGSEARTQARAIRVTGSDRSLLDRYQRVIDQSFVALTAVHEDVARNDFEALSADWRRVQEASRANSDMNVEFGLTACGSLQSPAAT